MHESRRERLHDYASTLLAAAGNIIVTFLVAGILARAWPVSDFLSYNLLNRYLNLAFACTSFGLGFGIVKYGTSYPASRVLAAASILSALICGAMIALLQTFAEEIARFLHLSTSDSSAAMACAGVWIVGQSLLYLVLAHLRATRQVLLANLLHFFGRGVAMLALALAVWSLHLVSVTQYYAAVGGIAAVASLLVIGSKIPLASFRPDIALSAKILSFSFSRFLDSLLKHLSGVALLSWLLFLGYQEVAGTIALLMVFQRGLEATCQPLVLLVFSDYQRAARHGSASQQVQAMWNCILLAMATFVPAVLLAGGPILHLWLGNRFAFMTLEFRIAVVGFAPMMAIVLMRGCLDGAYSFSPIAALNAVELVLGLLAAGALHGLGVISVANLLLMLAASRWLQLAAVGCLLRQRHDLKVFEPASLPATFRAISRKLMF